MGKKMLPVLVAAVMLMAGSTTAFAALGKAVNQERTMQSSAEKSRKVIKKASRLQQEKEEEVQAEAEWKEEMLESVNAARKKAGVPALKLNDKLCEAAQIRAKECLESYDHTRPNGKHLTTVLDEVGMKYGYWGENINEKEKTVASTMESWMNSAGHKANIEKKEFDSVGFGRAKDSEGRYYFVQLFVSAK